MVDISDVHNEEELFKESPFKSFLWDENQITVFIPTTGQQYLYFIFFVCFLCPNASLCTFKFKKLL